VTRRKWRHPWLVVRCFTAGESVGAVVILCSHRYEVTADWCARRRDLWARRHDRYHHDLRHIPNREEAHRG
jgi:hypothetical protein